MKKKIINGILLVAMLFAATTSFVSCKDNVDDELTLVYEKLAKQKSELSARIDNLEGQISSLQSELNNVKTDVSNIKGQIATLQSDVNDLKGRLAAVESQIATLSAEVDTIKSDLAALTERVEGIESNVNKLIALLAEGMITEIATNQTVNDVFGTINVPGFNAKVLAALFGDNQTYIEKFPATGADYNVFADGVTLDASDIAGAKFIEIYDDYISKPTGNAGKFFFTANSLDKSLFNINDWTLSLEASDGTVAPVYFENVQPSDYNVQWGAYKSVVLGSNESETDLGFYEADATIDRAYLEQCKLNARNYINFGDLKKDIQAAVNNIKAANGKKATLVSIAKEAAQLVEKYVSGQLSGDNRYLSNPTYSAQRLVMTKTIEDASVRFQDADLDVALTAIAPLSYNSFWQLEKNAKSPNLETVENLVHRLFNKMKSFLPKVDVSNVNIKKIEVPESPMTTTKEVIMYDRTKEYANYTDALTEFNKGGYDGIRGAWVDDYDTDGNWIGDHYAYFLGKSKEVEITPMLYVEGTTTEGDDNENTMGGWITKDGTVYWFTGGEYFTFNEAIYKPLVDAINEGLNPEELNDMIQNMGKQFDLGPQVDNVEKQFNSALERVANGIVNALKNHALTRAVSPIILFKTTEGVFRLASGTTVKPGYMQINMTSPTEELIVPPYEKYIAVKDANGKITESATVPGNTQKWTLNLTKAGDYTVILSCVDYYGYVVSKKYTVHVK